MRLGKDVRISPLAHFSYPELVEFGDHCAVDQFVVVSCRLTAGRYVHIPPHCSIIGGDKSTLVIEDFAGMSAGCHIICGSDDFSGGGLIGPMIPTTYRPTTRHATIRLCRYSYLATGVIVFPGVTIGEGSVVSAGSVVTKDLEKWGVYRGAPAVFVRERPPETVLAFAKALLEERGEL